VAVLRGPTIASGIGQFGAIQSAAPSLGMEASRVNVRDVGEIERAVVAFARKPNGGLVVTANSSALTHRDQIIALATRTPPAEAPYGRTRARPWARARTLRA
jgi:putative tryptophan/tyrosine transport system substrate-binding protein